MTIADKLRRTDISAYLLFMWNIEDVVRVYNLDFDRIDAEYIAKFPEEERDATRDWMENIVKMMQLENVRRHGHLQINKNVLIRLNDLHRELLKSPKFPEYGAEFYRTLPYIVELRAKAGDNPADELETCFNALYGMLLMRLQGKEISADTAAAIKQISRFIALLARDFHLDEADKLFPHDDDEDSKSKCKTLR